MPAGCQTKMIRTGLRTSMGQRILKRKQGNFVQLVQRKNQKIRLRVRAVLLSGFDKRFKSLLAAGEKPSTKPTANEGKIGGGASRPYAWGTNDHPERLFLKRPKAFVKGIGPITSEYSNYSSKKKGKKTVIVERRQTGG